MRNTSLPVVCLLSITALGSTHARAFGVDPKECKQLLDNVANNLPPEGSVDANRLATARSFLDRARTCIQNPLLALAPERGNLESELRAMEAKVADADARGAAHHKRQALAKEGDALAQTIRDHAGNALEQDQQAVTAWRAKVTAAGFTLNDTDGRLQGALDQAGKLKQAAAAGEATAALLKSSVVEQLPGFTADDSYDLKKVNAAFTQMSPDHLVVARFGGARYEPAGFFDNNNAVSKAPVKRRGWMDWRKGSEGIALAHLNLASDPLQKGTPGFIWAALDRGDVAFVALDGGRYRVPLASIAPAGGPVAIPTALVNDGLSEAEIHKLVEHGVVSPAARDAIRTARDAADACARKVWDSGTPEWKRIQTANITASTRANRFDDLQDRLWAKLRVTCKGKLTAANAAWLKVADARARDREALLKVAKRFER